MQSSNLLEPLEQRLFLAADMRFAIIGDYGKTGQPEYDVAALVKSWQPDEVLTLGDNNYPDGAASAMDANIGQYYHDFIYPYPGSYGPGSADGQNHFWPILGNHDWETPGATPYLNYFTLPNNERYYTLQRGNVAFFMVDSDPSEPSGNTANSVQGQWIKQQMLASTAKWKIVLDHHPAYTSGVAGNSTWMQWPFKDWGATAVMAGHDHDYERLVVNDLPYFVDGLGGDDITSFQTAIAGSQVRYNSDYGAMLITASDVSMTFQFVTRSGKVIDTYSVGQVPTPAAPTGLQATPLAYNQIGLSWIDNSSDESGFRIERSTDGVTFLPIATAATNATFFSDESPAPATAYTYRLTAINSGGASAYSNISSARTFDPASVTFVSDLNWVSMVNGWGPVERDMANGSSGSGDGGPINLNGVTYLKGLGAHAISQVVYNIGGQYATFAADVGIDESKGSEGSVVFQVIGDGTLLYQTGILRGSSPTQSLDVNIDGVQQLTLRITDAGDGIDVDHSDWAAARLVRASQTPVPPADPTGLSAVATNSNQVSLTWSDNASNESNYLVERSTDGLNFTQVATLAANVRQYSDSSLTAQTNYYYRVRASNPYGYSAYTNIASAKTPAVAAVTYLSDLAWLSATNGWGPVERDTSNGSSGAGDGQTITLNGVTYSKGLGVNSVSQITYALGGGYDGFFSDVGIDDEKGTAGTVVFQVMADGKLVYDSGLMTGSSATKSVSLNVAGVQQLVLIVNDGGDGNAMDHADWAGARLNGSGTVTPVSPLAPGSPAAITTGTASLAVTWTDSAYNETGYLIERSIDGVNFAQVASLPANSTVFNDSSLAANTRYYYRAAAVNNVGPSPYSAIVSAWTVNPASIKYLSDLTWASSTNGSGPVEKDMSNGGTGTNDGKLITLNGVTFVKGLGVNANSKIVYNLGGLYSTFVCSIGVDDEVGSSGSVVFQVLLDGKVVYDSGTMTGTSATKSLSISLGTAKQLALVVNDGKDGKTSDHADWAGARLILKGATSQALVAAATTSTTTKTSSLLTSSTKLLA